MIKLGGLVVVDHLLSLKYVPEEPSIFYNYGLYFVYYPFGNCKYPYDLEKFRLKF